MPYLAQSDSQYIGRTQGGPAHRHSRRFEVSIAQDLEDPGVQAILQEIGQRSNE